ncbi:hypothetical protein GGD67_002855 [Bradyrhizobium sp. IAR9]|uniref:hypothetical protein n=1 Tax=Bradyrhizobium sp. IAR9 TaxID=2663841 RepID=UPI0015CB3E99|nr:hypothetical protein [Bradyrhizobium sp. IAR9]NYG45397.1 hypothetical protein [Bradyrhizobium sp. IAR9]
MAGLSKRPDARSRRQGENEGDAVHDYLIARLSGVGLHHVAHVLTNYWNESGEQSNWRRRMVVSLSK